MQAPENQTRIGMEPPAWLQTRDKMGPEQNQAGLSNDLGVGDHSVSQLLRSLMLSQGNQEATQ